VSAFRPEGPFPNIFNVIPTDDVSDSWTVRDASGTADVLRTFRPSHAGRTPIVFDAMGSAVRATLSEDGTERSAILPMSVPNLSDTSMAANADYIRDAILHVGDGARVDMFGALRPFHFVADDDAETFALVMPMRIS
jgi:DNA polymerase III sliding clamp (beta) subunit (PCNA family)